MCQTLTYKVVYQFSWAAITKYHRLAGLNNRNLFFHNSGVQKSKIKLSAGLVSSKTSPWLADGHLPLYPHGHPFVLSMS